jgi:hypothetical protein
MGAVDCPGILRCAQDDSKNKQRQERTSNSKTSNSKKQKQIPFGDDNQRDNSKTSSGTK